MCVRNRVFNPMRCEAMQVCGPLLLSDRAKETRMISCRVKAPKSKKTNNSDPLQFGSLAEPLISFRLGGRV